MAEVQEYLKVLKCWRIEELKAISDALQKLSLIKAFKDEELDGILASVVEFHREIAKAKEEDISTGWFEIVIGFKKKLKKMQEVVKEKAQKALLEKKPVQIVVYPEALYAGKRPNDTHILKSLYKNFASNFEEVNSPQTIPFIQILLKELKFMFEDKPDEALHKRINSICHRLSRASAS
jgi:hypothetical protein